MWITLEQIEAAQQRDREARLSREWDEQMEEIRSRPDLSPEDLMLWVTDLMRDEGARPS